MRVVLLLITAFVHSFCNAQQGIRASDSTTATLPAFGLSAPVNTYYKAGIGTSLVQSSISAHFKSFSVDAILEHRIWRNMFVNAALETNYSFGQKVEMLNVYMPVGVRQYISLGKKRANRRDIFRAYIALQTHNSLYSSFLYDRSRIDLDTYYRGTRQKTIVNSGQYIEGPNLLEYAYFRLGYQFKISTDSYLDVSTIIPFRPLIYNKNSNGFTLASPALVSIKYGLIFRKATKVY